ncbi:MAG: hypothetical protein AMXMBFR61_26890 [Fimbriimonadales bacterium]
MVAFAAVRTFMTLLLASQDPTLAHVGGAHHLGEWIVRSDFVGIVVPVGSPETVWLDTTGLAAAHAGYEDKRYVTDENGRIQRTEVAFHEVRCKVERVMKGPELPEITILTYIKRNMNPRPKVLPAELEQGRSLLVVLTKPDAEGRIDIWQERKLGNLVQREIEPSSSTVKVRPGVWGLFNMLEGSFRVLSKPASGWPDPGGAPMHTLMECLLASLRTAPTSSLAGDTLELLALGGPMHFPLRSAVRSIEKLDELRLETLWPDYNDYCKTRVVPALRTWVTGAGDEHSALRGLSVILEYDHGEAVRSAYFERLLACARTQPDKCCLGGSTILADFPGHESQLLRLFDAGLETYALDALRNYATEQSVPYAKRTLQPNPRLQAKEQRERCIAAMRILARVYKDTEHAPPTFLPQGEDEEMWKPGGLLAELLDYWRNHP